jgi:DNA replication protein DnaC
LVEITEKYVLLAELCEEHGIALDDPQIVGVFIALYGQSGVGGRIGAANLPSEYLHTTLKSSPARGAKGRLSDESTVNIYKYLAGHVKSFARQFTDEANTIKSVYLHSNAKGNGKTTTAAALVNEWIRANYIGAIKYGKQPSQRPALFFDVNEWLIEYNLIAMGGNNDDEVKAFKAKMLRAAHVPFLVMDDLGVREASEKFRGYLHYIVNYRCANRLPTVYTSNREIETLAEIFDERLYDRARDQCVIIEFAGTKSKRGLRK